MRPDQECSRCGLVNRIAGLFERGLVEGPTDYTVTCSCCGHRWDALAYAPPAGRVAFRCAYCKWPLQPWPEPFAAMLGLATARCTNCGALFTEAAGGERGTAEMPEALRVRKA